MLEQLQLAVGPFREDRSAEGLHDLLDSDRLAGQLVSRRAVGGTFRSVVGYLSRARRDGRAGLELATYQTSPKAPMPTGCKSVYLALRMLAIDFDDSKH